MAKPVQLSASARSDRANQIRRAGSIPAVLYGDGVESENVQVDTKQFRRAFAESGYTTLIDLDVNGKLHNVLVREIQFHPVRDEVLHVDFYQVRMDEAVTAEVPLVFTGEAPAVKDLGGVFVRSIDAVEVEALPRDLPHNIEVDISGLAQFDEAIHIKDLKLSAGVEILHHEPEDVVALVQPPRSEEELESLAEEVKEDVESVEKAGAEKKEEDEEAAEGEAAEGEEKKEE